MTLLDHAIIIVLIIAGGINSVAILLVHRQLRDRLDRLRRDLDFLVEALDYREQIRQKRAEAGSSSCE